MLEQLLLSGQHRPDDEPSKDMQFVPDGHLKSLGSLGSTAEQDRSSRLTSWNRASSSEKDLPKAEAEDNITDKVHRSRRPLGLENKYIVVV